MTKNIERLKSLIEQDRLVEAESMLTQLLTDEPESAEVSALLGILYAKSGRVEAAAPQLERALSLEPSRLDARKWLAMVRKSQGRPKEAVLLLQEVLEQDAEDIETRNLLGVCYISLGRAKEAEDAFRMSQARQPDSAVVHANLGLALRLQGRGEEALDEFRKAVELDPRHPPNHVQVFKQLQQLSRWDEAILALEAGTAQLPESLLISEALAVAYGRLNRSEDAEAIFRKIAPQSASAANSYCTWLQEEGRFEDSVDASRISLGLQPLQGLPYRCLVEARQTEFQGRSILQIAERLTEDPRLDDLGKMHLAYARGRLYDQTENYRDAMRAYDLANEIAFRSYAVTRTFDAAWTAREPNLIASLYSESFLDSVKDVGVADHRPIFIVGMIRSGTTLLDQIISAHPQVVSVGEPIYWNAVADPLHSKWSNTHPSQTEVAAIAQNYLHAVGSSDPSLYISDKMPLNYRNLGPIHVTFPNARILHIRRDAFDTCLSIYSTFFGGGPNFVYRQENIVAFYRAYLRHMEHWKSVLPADRYLEIGYESLVSNPEPLTRDILAFLGLRWNDACLHPEDNRSQIATPSRWQARQPIYRSSVGKRERYLPYVGMLGELE